MSREKINIRQMARPCIRDLKPYASAKDEFKDFEQEMIYLDANENPYDNGLNRYPDPHQSTLKQKISEVKKVAVSNILLGLSLIHISEPTRLVHSSRMPSSA